MRHYHLIKNTQHVTGHFLGKSLNVVKGNLRHETGSFINRLFRNHRVKTATEEDRPFRRFRRKREVGNIQWSQIAKTYSTLPDPPRNLQYNFHPTSSRTFPVTLTKRNRLKTETFPSKLRMDYPERFNFRLCSLFLFTGVLEKVCREFSRLRKGRR